jgi:DnaJ-class molecular chaperone
MFPSLLITVKVLNEKEEGQGSMSYKKTCSLCNGNGYIKVKVKENYETKQCWLCESTGEKEYSQAEVDDFIYKMYYKKGGTKYVNKPKRN